MDCRKFELGRIERLVLVAPTEKFAVMNGNGELCSDQVLCPNLLGFGVFEVGAESDVTPDSVT